MKIIVLSLLLALVQGGRICTNPKSNDGESYTEGCLKMTCKAGVWRSSLHRSLCCYNRQPYFPNTTITATEDGCARAVIYCKEEDDVATAVLQVENTCGEHSTEEQVQELKHILVKHMEQTDCDKDSPVSTSTTSTAKNQTLGTEACGCNILGSIGMSCTDNGICDCKENFVGEKCDECAADRFNYPLCEECNCNFYGVTENFFAMGGCASVTKGELCECKQAVTGRTCSRCQPEYFGFPECQPCNCPPTTICNEQTGECTPCAPFVTGTPEYPCSQCEVNTFGYDAINGCQECNCMVEGTVGYNMSCSLDVGQCYCKENVEGRACDHCRYGSYAYPHCETCDCDLRGTTERICDQSSAQCFCKTNVQQGYRCDTCKEGHFNLQESNPDGCM